jgi:capsular polysaccharide transport system ATP-binding protein
MIYLHAVTKSVLIKGEPPKLVFRPMTISVPMDRRVAILGNRQQGKTLLLRLLAGLEAPDTGEVITPPGLSPIANSKRLFHPLFSGVENIQLFARLSGVDGNILVAAVGAFCGENHLLEKPISRLNGIERQQLEIALLSLLSFDCYLLDDALQVPPSLLERYFDAAARRKAGMIFTTALPRQVYEYADYALVIRDRTVRAFNHVEEAIESYERKAG